MVFYPPPWVPKLPFGTFQPYKGFFAPLELLN